MALSEEIQKGIEEKIKPFLKICPLCGKGPLGVNQDLYLHPALDLETKKVKNEGLYVILATCINCANTVSFSTARAGITEPI